MDALSCHRGADQASSQPGEERAHDYEQEQCRALAVLYLEDVIDSLGLCCDSKHEAECIGPQRSTIALCCQRAVANCPVGPAVPPTVQTSETRSTRGLSPKLWIPIFWLGPPLRDPYLVKSKRFWAERTMVQTKHEAEANVRGALLSAGRKVYSSKYELMFLSAPEDARPTPPTLVGVLTQRGVSSRLARADAPCFSGK